MNFAALIRAFDALVAFGDAARRLKGGPPSNAPAGRDAGHAGRDTGLTPSPPPPGIAGHLEARLTNVVVAALKEAFDRDHARLELERQHIEEQRRRAEEALRAEVRRHAADREVGRLRLLAGTALVGWIASVALLVARLDAATAPSRIVAAVSWLLLLGALAAAFTAQGRVSAHATDGSVPLDAGSSGAAALWLLVAGLALAAVSLLF